MADTWDRSADLVVIGFGGAGAAAALAGAELGASVLILEKQPHDRHTPSTAMSGGIVMATNDVERATAYLDRCAGGMIPLAVSRAWAAKGTDLVPWLDKMGADLALERIGGAGHPEFEGAEATRSAAFVVAYLSESVCFGRLAAEHAMGRVLRSALGGQAGQHVLDGGGHQVVRGDRAGRGIPAEHRVGRAHGQPCSQVGVTGADLAEPLAFGDHLGDQLVVEPLAALEAQVALAGQLVALGEVDAEGVHVLQQGAHVPFEQQGETADGGLLGDGDGPGLLEQRVAQVADDPPEQVFLGFEVVIEQRPRDAELVGDLLQAGLPETAAAEELDRVTEE